MFEISRLITRDLKIKSTFYITTISNKIILNSEDAGKQTLRKIAGTAYNHFDWSKSFINTV